MPRLRLAKLVLTALFVLTLSPHLNAQSKVQPKTLTKPKLTPQQRIGLEILDQQAGVAKGLPPVTRAFALLDISRGYERLVPPKALNALRDALQASQSIEESSEQRPSTKADLQGQIVRQLVHLDPAYCERLIPQLTGSAKFQAIDLLVTYHARKKQFTQAIALLSQVSDQEFPYLAVSRLMQALPPEIAAEKQNLFAQALASFSQHDHKNGPGLEDFGMFLSRTWQGLPPDLVLQAVDEVLKQARQSDTKLEITAGAKKGAASFSSVYEYTLFEVMPVLRALDPERADSILQENTDLQSTMKQFPNGLQSLDPETGTPESLAMRGPGSGASGAAADRYFDDLRRRSEQVLAQAAKDPKQALAAAMSLPDFRDIRAYTLLGLAGAIWKNSPTYAEEALDQLLKIVPSVQQPVIKAHLLAGAGEDYLKLGKMDSASKAVDQGFQLAESVYATDTDASDPNQAVKPEWPSTSVWRRFVSLAERISPQTALQAINSIPDPEIQSLETIALANSLLGAPPGLLMVSVQTKSNHSYMIGVQ